MLNIARKADHGKRGIMLGGVAGWQCSLWRGQRREESEAIAQPVAAKRRKRGGDAASSAAIAKSEA